jgi:glycosyltransferase involved in cell wall biosynthesis
MDLIRRDVDEQPPDLIHVQTRSVLSQGMWLARRLDRPVVLTVHDYLGPRERLRVDQTCVRRIIAVSEAVKAELIEREAFPDDYVTVIRSGVAVPEIVEAPPVLDPGHTPVVGTAGPLESVKGLPFFLGAAAKVLAARDNIEFLVAGAGPEERSLRRLARELGITGKVTFIPKLYDFSQSLEAMDIYCLPSLRQGLGTIMLEAMARARPVIAAGVGGVSSAVRDNETGLVVPPSDSGRLAERIIELLDDPLRARAIGEAGRTFVRDEFAVEKMVERTAQLYRSVCGVEVAA